MTPPALFFHADAIESAGTDLVGRRSAGQSFLRGFLAHVPGDCVQAVTETRAAAVQFERVARDLGETRPIRAVSFSDGTDFTSPGTIFFPGPGYQAAPWLRQRHGVRSCSLVGITHTVSTRRVMMGLHTLLSDPVHDWDAIVCTSRAVQSVVARQWNDERAYLADRFGASRVPMPQLPVIPLGIHTADFAPRSGARDAMRDRFGAGDAFVVMSMGRLTGVEKANMIPLYLALEQIAQALARPVHLWQVGWASRQDEERLHREAAVAYCPSVMVRQIDGRDGEIRRDIWAGADVFTLPVDNVQETFGLAPVEAMAAGLPVVMPDWNGFRDTVVDGETGFLIPTRMTPPGQWIGRELAARFADGRDTYLHHLSLLQQQTQIDVARYRQALSDLATNADLRARMGQAGRDHVARTFDWSAVIPQYLALSDELAARRAASVDRASINPTQIDPFDLFAAYPTASPTPDWIVCVTRALDVATLNRLDDLNGRTLYKRKQVSAERITAFHQAVGAVGAQSIATVADRLQMRPDVAIGIALFLAKYDFLKLNPD